MGEGSKSLPFLNKANQSSRKRLLPCKIWEANSFLYEKIPFCTQVPSEMKASDTDFRLKIWRNIYLVYLVYPPIIILSPSFLRPVTVSEMPVFTSCQSFLRILTQS